ATPSHDPAQEAADQRIRSVVTVRGILYAGHHGRGGLLLSHKIQERATAVSRYASAPSAATGASRYTLSPQPHAGYSQNPQDSGTQRETATVIHGKPGTNIWSRSSQRELTTSPLSGMFGAHQLTMPRSWRAGAARGCRSWRSRRRCRARGTRS